MREYFSGTVTGSLAIHLVLCSPIESTTYKVAISVIITTLFIIVEAILRYKERKNDKKKV